MKGSIKTKLDEKANKRDGFKCIQCGNKHGIETHHIVPELEKLSNLITLCHSCHKKEHDMAGCFKPNKYDSRRSHKLKPGEAWLIKKLLYHGKFQQDFISKLFNISPRSVSDIKNGMTWNYV